MKCWLCLRPIATAEASKRVEWRTGPDTAPVLFGADNPPLSLAGGRLVKAAHGKCYWVWHKQRNRPMAADRSEEHLEETPGEDDGSGG